MIMMEGGRALFCSLGCILLLCGIVTGSETQFIDDNDMEEIAHVLCEVRTGSRTQIERVSTVKRLIEFFNGLPADHKLSYCRDHYAKTLHDLSEILSIGNEDVCSPQKLDQIEEFHHKFISRTRADKELREIEHNKIPIILAFFFMQYVNRVGETCKRSLIEQLEGDSAELPQAPESELGRVDDLLRRFATKLWSNSDDSHSYPGVFLMWNIIDKLPFKNEREQFGKGDKLLRYKTSEPENMHFLQQACLTDLKPVYEPLVLPILKLIDLGYYVDDEPFVTIYTQRQDIQRLFNVAQLCEFVLPIQAIKDTNMGPGEMVLITREEADATTAEEFDSESTKSAVPRFKFDNSLKDLNSVSTASMAHVIVDSIQANIEAREQVVARILKALGRLLKEKAKAMIGKLFYSLKSKISGKFEREDATPKIEELAVKSQEHGLTRRRRDIRDFKADIAMFMEYWKKDKYLGLIIGFVTLFKWFVDVAQVLFFSLKYVLCKAVAIPYEKLYKKPKICEFKFGVI